MRALLRVRAVCKQGSIVLHREELQGGFVFKWTNIVVLRKHNGLRLLHAVLTDAKSDQIYASRSAYDVSENANNYCASFLAFEYQCTFHKLQRYENRDLTDICRLSHTSTSWGSRFFRILEILLFDVFLGGGENENAVGNEKKNAKRKGWLKKKVNTQYYFW